MQFKNVMHFVIDLHQCVLFLNHFFDNYVIHIIHTFDTYLIII